METHRRDIEAGQSGPQHMPTRAVPPQSIIGDPNEPYQQNKYREVRRHNASAVQYQYSTVHAAQQCTVVPSSVAVHCSQSRVRCLGRRTESPTTIRDSIAPTKPTRKSCCELKCRAKNSPEVLVIVNGLQYHADSENDSDNDDDCHGDECIRVHDIHLASHLSY